MLTKNISCARACVACVRVCVYACWCACGKTRGRTPAPDSRGYLRTGRVSAGAVPIGRYVIYSALSISLCALEPGGRISGREKSISLFVLCLSNCITGPKFLSLDILERGVSVFQKYRMFVSFELHYSTTVCMFLSFELH